MIFSKRSKSQHPLAADQTVVFSLDKISFLFSQFSLKDLKDGLKPLCCSLKAALTPQPQLPPAHINALPTEIVNQIFSNLSFNDLLSLQLVSARYYAISRQHRGYTLHFRDPESFESQLEPFLDSFLAIPLGTTTTTIVTIGHLFRPLSVPTLSPRGSFHFQILWHASMSSEGGLSLRIKARAQTVEPRFSSSSISSSSFSSSQRHLHFHPWRPDLSHARVSTLSNTLTLTEVFALPPPVITPTSSSTSTFIPLTGSRLYRLISSLALADADFRYYRTVSLQLTKGTPIPITRYYRLTDGEEGRVAQVVVAMINVSLPTPALVKKAFKAFRVRESEAWGGRGYDMKKTDAWKCAVELMDEARRCMEGTEGRWADLIEVEAGSEETGGWIVGSWKPE